LVSANLTSDAETGLGQWSLEQIVRALREGQAPDRALKLSYGLVETIAMKFTRPLPATTPKALTYADGNFAIDPTKGSPTSIQTILIGAQWVILVLGLILVVRARPRPKIETLIVSALVVTGAGGLLYLLSQWPAIRGMPPDPW
jgi:hypothetical protein